jgi:hypothetical protein
LAGADLRGFLGCFVQFQGSFGVLLLFSAGCFLNWWQLAGTTVSLSHRKIIRVNKEATSGKPEERVLKKLSLADLAKLSRLRYS